MKCQALSSQMVALSNEIADVVDVGWEVPVNDDHHTQAGVPEPVVSNTHGLPE
jgi:hypothetical protein